MKLKIITLAVFYLVFSFELYSQGDPRGIIGDHSFKGKFEFIPYTGPTGPPENSNPKPGNFNGKANRSAFQIIDSLIIEDIIPAGTTYSIKYNHLNKTFTKISPIPDLTADAMTAINSSPKWLRNDLYDNLRRLDEGLQNEYAQVIINSDTLFRDEVAFQVAHLSTNMTLPTMNDSIPLANARGIYLIAPDLKYVKLVEYGSAFNGDWYTTTSYRIIDDKGDTVWREIPRDIYYWWVLMPIVYEESPRMDSTVSNEFWRTYVYNNADVDSGCPVLKDVLKGIKVYWDGKNHHWNNHDSNGKGLPFGDSLTAVEALGRWVAQTITQDAIPPRPSQPNLALHDHNGNCGEIQDLQTSGGRAGLMPLMPITSWPGDHVWNEIYWPDSAKWAFYQVARVSGPTDVNWAYQWPTSACITAMRPDGYREMVNEHYNPVCTVTVVVQDNNGKPVDGAEVIFLAPPYFDPHSITQVMIGSWGHTDENGELTVKLATDFNYFIRSDWENGHVPANPTKFYSLVYTDVTEGDHKWMYLNDGVNSAKDMKYDLIPGPPPGKQSIQVEFEVPYHVTYGGSFWDYSLWEDDFLYAHKTESGSIRSFLCDYPNYFRYNNDSLFDVYTYCDSLTTCQMSIDLKDKENYYVGFSNMSKLKIAEFAKVKVYLYEETTASVSEQNPDKAVQIFPNPSDGIFHIENLLNNGENESLEIISSVGSLVNQFHFERNENNKEINLSALPKGIYFLRTYGKENTEVKKLIIQ